MKLNRRPKLVKRLVLERDEKSYLVATLFDSYPTRFHIREFAHNHFGGIVGNALAKNQNRFSVVIAVRIRK